MAGKEWITRCQRGDPAARADLLGAGRGPDTTRLDILEGCDRPVESILTIFTVLTVTDQTVFVHSLTFHTPLPPTGTPQQLPFGLTESSCTCRSPSTSAVP